MYIQYHDMTDGKATVCHVAAVIGDKAYYGEGSSRKMSGDTFDEATGELIAYTRALEKLVAEMKKDYKKHCTVRSGKQ